MQPPSCPSRLYKYFGADRAGILNAPQIRFSPLGAFNDPFEGRPEITSLGVLEVTLAPKTLHLHINGREPLVIPDYLMRDPAVQAILSQLLPHTNEAIEANKGEVVEQIHTQIDEQIGVLCLSEVPDSLLMWSHYASSHTGFVLEVNAHHDWFHKQRSPDEEEYGNLRRVLYREARPSGSLRALQEDDLFVVKSGHWAYEREWRVLRPFIEATAKIDAVPFPVHLFALPREAVTGVILGARASSSTESSIRRSLESGSYNHVSVRRATPDPSHFLRRLVPIDR